MSTIKHILVTGGGGYIGSVLVPFLLKKNYKVTVIDRFFFKLNYKLHKNLTIIKNDTQNIDDQTLKKIDCVIDLVAIANDVSGDYFKNQTIKTNYLSRLKTAKLAKKNGVQQYILPSSASVYGFKPNNIKVDENTKPTPLTHYSKNNLKADWSISISGVAGPEGGSIDKPVGLVYIAITNPNNQTIKIKKQFKFIRNRNEIQRLSVNECLNRLRLILLSYKD